MKYTLKKKRLILAAFVIDAIGALFFWGRSRPTKKIDAPRSFVVTRIDHLGDLLLSLPVAYYLKKRYPGSRVCFVTSGICAALLKNNPFIDQIILYDAPWFKRGGHQKSISFFQLAKKLRGEKFEVGLSLRGDARENLLLFLSRIPVRIGYGITGGGFLLTHEMAYDKTIAEYKRIAALLRPLDIEPESWKPELYFDDDEKKLSDKKWQTLGVDPAKMRVGMQVDAVVSSREWPRDLVETFFKEVAHRFPDVQLILVGTGKRELSLLEKRDGLLDLRNKTTVRELCLLLKTLDVFIGLDSGPSHLAAAMGVPTLCLYSGTTDIGRWTPLGPSVYVFRNPVVCAPCAHANCPVKGHPCMQGIDPKTVVDKISQIFQARH